MVTPYIVVNFRKMADAMTPPFESRQDARHIVHAYHQLVPGGQLVSVACEGSFSREHSLDVEFRAWLAKVGAEVAKLPSGSFKGSGTGVAARIVSIVKEAT